MVYYFDNFNIFFNLGVYINLAAFFRQNVLYVIYSLKMSFVQAIIIEIFRYQAHVRCSSLVWTYPS